MAEVGPSSAIRDGQGWGVRGFRERQIEAVRRSGLTNMLDRPAVAHIAEEMGFEASARWVREHRDLYAHAIFHGFEVVEQEGA
jgi:hypothetical protein